MAVRATAKSPGDTTSYLYFGRLYNHMIGDQSRPIVGSRSINDGQTPYIARVTVSLTATSRSWWAFFLRYMAARKASS
jgi:hypothetical protein